MNSNVFIHKAGIVEDGAKIGSGSRVWAFSHILGGAVIGADCNICDHVFIENDVTVGDRVTIKCGVQLWDGVRVEDDVMIGPNVTFTNDKYPRSKQPFELVPTQLMRGCSVGANSTVLPGITIGQWAMIGAGSVVTKNVGGYCLALGNPARHVGYICRCGKQMKIVQADQFICSCGQKYKVLGKELIEKIAL